VSEVGQECRRLTTAARTVNAGVRKALGYNPLSTPCVLRCGSRFHLKKGITKPECETNRKDHDIYHVGITNSDRLPGNTYSRKCYAALCYGPRDRVQIPAASTSLSG
jgi:hypothetical protein